MGEVATQVGIVVLVVGLVAWTRLRLYGFDGRRTPGGRDAAVAFGGLALALIAVWAIAQVV